MYNIYYFDKLKNNSVTSYLTPFSTAQTIGDVQGDTELYHRENVNGIQIKYIGIRLSASARFILAVVDGADIQKDADGVIIGLEITETHDYAKTLVDNEARRTSWNQQIADFIQSLRDTAAKAPAIAPVQDERKPRSITSYRGRLLAFDAAQAVIADQPIEQGVLCFGGAGTGKSMLLECVLEQYVTLKQGRVAHFAPNAKLCRDTQQSLQEKIPEADFVRLHSFTWEDFLKYLRTNGFDVPLSEHLKPVNLDYFSAWLNHPDRYNTKQKNKDTKNIRGKYSDTTLWKDYLFTILQLSYPEATEPYISEEIYYRLGRVQSYVEREDRVTIYQSIFKPFLDSVIADTAAYEPRLMAYQLSRQLLVAPDLNQHLFDAMVIDEQTLYHPYQLLCMLLMHKDITAGWFFLCGDISQSVDMLNPHFVEDLLKLLQSRRVAEQKMLITTLENNHRNSETGTRFVSLLHEIEKQIYGSFDRHTHSCVLSKGHALSGSVNTYDYSPELKQRIAQDPEAVVLVPNERYKQQVLSNKQWLAGQVFTLREMQGSQVRTVVMDGFSGEHAEALKELEHYYMRAENLLPALNTQRPYAREKNISQSLTLLEAIQGWYTAASRPLENLIITESSTAIHQLWSTLMRQIEIKAVAPPLEKLPASKEAWLKRINVLLEEEKFEQVDALLLRNDIWGEEWLSQMSQFNLTEKMTFLQQTLNPNTSLTTEKKSMISTENRQSKTPLRFFEAAPKPNAVIIVNTQPAPPPSTSTTETPPQKAPLSKTLTAIKALLNSPNQENFQKLYDTTIRDKYPNPGDYLKYFLSIEVSDEQLEIKPGGSNKKSSCSVFQRLMTSKQAVIAISALLKFALKNSLLESIQLLKKIGVVLQYENPGITEWLCQAINTNNLGTLDTILKLGYNPNWIRRDYGTCSLPALHLAIMKGSVSAIDLLISYGADIELRADIQFNSKTMTLTPLQCATDSDNIEAIDTLLNAGAQIEAMSLPNKETPLIIAVSKNNIRSVARLMKWGANIYHENAAGANSVYIASALGRLDILKILNKNEANLGDSNSKGHLKPIHAAILDGHLKIFQYFIENKVDINFRETNIEGIHEETLLHWTIQEKQIQMAIYLLEKGASVNATYGKEQKTALMLAASELNVSFVNLLIQFHADVNYESTYDKKTALSIAVLKNAVHNKNACQVVEALIKAGADYEKKIVLTDGQLPIPISIRSIAKEVCDHCYQLMDRHYQKKQVAEEDEASSNKSPGF